MGEVIDLPNYKTLQQRFDAAINHLRQTDPLTILTLPKAERDALAGQMARTFLRHTHRTRDAISPVLEQKAERVVQHLFTRLSASCAAEQEGATFEPNMLKLHAHWKNLLPRCMEALHEDCVKPRPLSKINAYLR